MSAPIVVATDFSTRSDRALRRATMLAKQFSAALSLVHVVDDDQPQYLVDSQMNAARSVFEDAARTIAKIDDVATQANVLSGDVFSAILKVAEAVEASLIIMGPHRRQFRDAFFGTTAERTIARSPRPVLMTAGVPSAPYGRTLIALGIDDVSKSAAQRVQKLGILNRTEIVALHVFDAPAEGMMKLAGSEREAIDHYVAGEKRRANGEFSAFLTEVGLRAARQVLAPINGTAARTILERTRAEDVALIVVGTSQQTGIKRFLLGSVAEDILGGADRDALVVPKG